MSSFPGANTTSAQFSALPLSGNATINPYIPGISGGNTQYSNTGFNSGAYQASPYAGGQVVTRSAGGYLGPSGKPNTSTQTLQSILSGGSSGAQFGGTDLMSQVMNMINMQLGENEKKANLTEQEYREAKGNLLGIPGRFENDSIYQGARGLASNLLADPEAINDQTQQKIINRGSNLINASQNAAGRQAQGDLAAAGQLGGSAQQILQDRMQRSRENQLGTMASEAEIQRALRRNEDIRNATQLGQGVAGQRADIDQNVGKTFIENTPEWKPQDFTGLIAALGLNQGLIGSQMSQQNGLAPGVDVSGLRTLQNVGGHKPDSGAPSTYAGMDFNVPGIGYTGGTQFAGNTGAYGALGGGSIPGLQTFGIQPSKGPVF